MTADRSGPVGPCRRPMRRALTAAVLATSMLASAACGSSSGSSGSSGPNKAAFCAANKKLDTATASASNVGDVVKDLKNAKSTVDQFAQTAPSAIKTQANVLVTAADNAIKSGSTAGFDQKFADAGMAVDKYCGQS
jgi:ABC-type oligopeptide transport system substrate-binding subunit